MHFARENKCASHVTYSVHSLVFRKHLKDILCCYIVLQAAHFNKIGSKLFAIFLEELTIQLITGVAAGDGGQPKIPLLYT